MSNLYVYNLFKQDFKAEEYLLLNIPWRFRNILTKFRPGNTSLAIETGHHTHSLREYHVCSFCTAKNIAVFEDEYHVILIYQTYEDLRNHYLGNVENDSTLLFT